MTVGGGCATTAINLCMDMSVGTSIGNNAVLAVAWCVGLALVGYLWARVVYNRAPVR